LCLTPGYSLAPFGVPRCSSSRSPRYSCLSRPSSRLATGRIRARTSRLQAQSSITHMMNRTARHALRADFSHLLIPGVRLFQKSQQESRSPSRLTQRPRSLRGFSTLAPAPLPPDRAAPAVMRMPSLAAQTSNNKGNARKKIPLRARCAGTGWDQCANAAAKGFN
jgi:hypothetical protein